MENKQETLEEAADRLSNTIGATGINDKHSFMLGVFWQQKRSYSEEDMQDFAKFCLLCKDEELPYIFPKDWLKHIKNKIK